MIFTYVSQDCSIVDVINKCVCVSYSCIINLQIIFCFLLEKVFPVCLFVCLFYTYLFCCHYKYENSDDICIYNDICIYHHCSHLSLYLQLNDMRI